MSEEKASKSLTILMIVFSVLAVIQIFITYDQTKDYEEINQERKQLNIHIEGWNEKAGRFTDILHKHNENYLSKTDSLCPAMLRLEQHFRTGGQYERMEY